MGKEEGLILPISGANGQKIPGVFLQPNEFD
jgi:hypothetical protein